MADPIPGKRYRVLAADGTSLDRCMQYVRLLHRRNAFANLLAFDQPVRVQAALFVLLGLPPVFLWASLILFTSSVAEVASIMVGWAACRLVLRSLRRRAFGVEPAANWPMSLLSEQLQPIRLLDAFVSRSLADADTSSARERRLLPHPAVSH